MTDDELKELIRQLELKLLHSDMKNNPLLLDLLLARGFEEIDAQGQVHSRTKVVKWLQDKSAMDHWTLTGFRIKKISDDVVLAIYSSRKMNGVAGNNKGTKRMSVWHNDGSDWKMVFHQASKQLIEE